MASSIFGDVFGRIVSTIQSQINGMTAWMVQVQNMGTSLAQKAQQKLQKFIQTLTGQPRSKQDYWYFMGTYFSKRFVILSTVVVTVLGYLVVTFAYPWAEGKWWRANIRLDSPKYSQFSGMAQVVDSMGMTIYYGDMLSGSPSGMGTQYDSDEILVYSGEFKSGKYNGEGKLYNNEGVVIYSGQFENNKFHGEGHQYNNLGKVIYIGKFEVGKRSGKGIEYDSKTGLKLYYGEFLNDYREGNGVEYDKDGEGVIYEGGFKGGVRGGQGKLYQNGNLIYSGMFLDGLYGGGTGSTFDADTGVMIYSGEFKEGKYDGAGKLYDIDTGVAIYEGEFSKGRRQGAGTSYDKLGSKSFDGTFRSDSIDYIGYLGAPFEDVVSQFGQESYKKEENNKLIITYLNLDASIVFKVDPEKGIYVCEKVILGTKEEFMGLGARSTAIERQSVMGDPFSSINFSCPSYYKTVFSHLAININNVNAVPSDKYIMDNYFIRFYFNDGRTELKCIEICMM
jgi:hypothetical protein